MTRLNWPASLPSRQTWHTLFRMLCSRQYSKLSSSHESMACYTTIEHLLGHSLSTQSECSGLGLCLIVSQMFTTCARKSLPVAASKAVRSFSAAVHQIFWLRTERCAGGSGTHSGSRHPHRLTRPSSDGGDWPDPLCSLV